MIAILWRYEVIPEHRAEFEATYGPVGDWARLFARSGGFRGTELMKADDGSYLTIDVWRARADFDAFITQWATDAKNWGHPFFLRFDWEMNGNWQFPWSVQLNGNAPAGFAS